MNYGQRRFMTLCRRQGSRPSPRKRNAKKEKKKPPPPTTKCFFEEHLQIIEKRRKVKGKGEKQRYTHLNVEFQIIARRDKKAFLSKQCK